MNSQVHAEEVPGEEIDLLEHNGWYNEEEETRWTGSRTQVGGTVSAAWSLEQRLALYRDFVSRLSVNLRYLPARIGHLMGYSPHVVTSSLCLWSRFCGCWYLSRNLVRDQIPDLSTVQDLPEDRETILVIASTLLLAGKLFNERRTKKQFYSCLCRMYNLKEDVYYAEAWQRHLHTCEFTVTSRLGFNLKPLIRENPLLYLEGIRRDIPEEYCVDRGTSYWRCLNLMTMPLNGVWLSARSVAMMAALDSSRINAKVVLLKACPTCPVDFVNLISDETFLGTII